MFFIKHYFEFEKIMEKEGPFYQEKEWINSSLYNKIYGNIKNLLYNLQSPDYKNVKNIILNFIEQNLGNIHVKNFIQPKKDRLFLMFLYNLCQDKILDNPILEQLIKNNSINSIKDADSLFVFLIKKEKINPNKQKCPKNKQEMTNKESFTLSTKSEKEYQEILLNYPDICNNIKQMTIQILTSLSFSGSKIPTTPIKFKHFVASFIYNQKFTKLVKEKLKLDYDKISKTITEGIIIDFIKMGIVFFPTDNKIQYFLNVIEREKYRLTSSNYQQESNTFSNYTVSNLSV